MFVEAPLKGQGGLTVLESSFCSSDKLEEATASNIHRDGPNIHEIADVAQ